MFRRSLSIFLLAVLALTPAGCSFGHFGGGPGYTLDAAKIGTGEPAFRLRNDGFYSEGQPVDARRR